MAQKIDSDELANIKDLLIACSIQVDTAVKLLIEKGFFTEAEFFTKLKKVQAIYLKNGKKSKQPVTVDEADNLLMDELSFGDRTIMANMKEEDLGILDFTFRKRIRREFGLGNGNGELLQSCRFGSSQPSIDPESASVFIIKRLWTRVQKTRVLRVAK